jgi:hypothetical protein
MSVERAVHSLSVIPTDVNMYPLGAYPDWEPP